MRIAALLLGWSALLWPVAAQAQDKEEDPFKGPTRVVKDVGSKVELTIPEKWQEREVSGTTILSLFAPGNLGQGGHGLLLVREEGQADLKRQRDRYKTYDAGKDEAATFEMIDEPFFGYRCHLPSGRPKKVIIRRFMVDTPDGLVLSVTSRLNTYYDRVWKDQIYAIIASARSVSSSGGGGSLAGAAGDLKRFFSEDGRASFVATDKWRTFETIEEGALVAVRFGVGGAAPALVLADRGYTTSKATVLAQLAGRLKKRHPQIKRRMLRGSPPRMLLKGRRDGSVDYVMAFKNGTNGYTLMLTVQEPEYDRFRTFCDEVAQSLVFSAQAYEPPEQPKGSIAVELGRAAIVHGEPENKGLVERTAKRLRGFGKPWKRVGLGKSKNRPPLRILVVPESRFKEATQLYGELPAVYHPGLRLVVVTPPPREGYERWRGRAYFALGEALLHRDLRVAAPAWLKEGVHEFQEVVYAFKEILEHLRCENPACKSYLYVLPRKAQPEEMRCNCGKTSINLKTGA
ncbi:MAG: hypothetical protein ACE10D_02435 [Planctomycetota bacterium]